MIKQKKYVDKLETQLLRTDDKYREQYQQRNANQLNDIDSIDQLEDRYARFVSIMTTSAQETLPKVYVKPKQKWMTKYILDKIDTRRKAKPKLDEEIKSKCHAAKERMLTEKYDLIEQLESAHKFHQTHAQIRKVTGRGNNVGVTTCIEDRDGNIIME